MMATLYAYQFKLFPYAIYPVGVTTSRPFLMQIIIHNSMTINDICTKLGT